MTFTYTDALAMAAVIRVEHERREWQDAFRKHSGGEIYVDVMRDYDFQASRALTQSLADAACDAVVMATRAKEAEEQSQ